MGTQVPWFRYGVRELKRQIRWSVQHGYRWDVYEWTDALQRALRLRDQRAKARAMLDEWAWDDPPDDSERGPD